MTAELKLPRADEMVSTDYNNINRPVQNSKNQLPAFISTGQQTIVNDNQLNSTKHAGTHLSSLHPIA